MRGTLAALAVGLVLTGGVRAEAQASPSRADDARAPAPPTSQISSGTDTDQISSPAGGAGVTAGQIGGPSRGAAIAPSQLTRPLPRADAPSPLSAPGQGRNTSIAAVKGHDRCDPAGGASANQPECARIIDNRANEFAAPAQEQSQPAVHPDATSSGLVNDILNGGTGSVVVLPGK
jgi:hypothetical protein